MAIGAFADWVESRPTEKKEFKEWYDAFWDDYAKHCYDVSRNIYIMRECLLEFERLLEEDMAWQDAICHSKLLEKKKQICLSVEVAPDEFFDDTTNRVYMQRCRKIWERCFSDDE